MANKDIVISIRLNEEEYKRFDTLITKTGESKSSFFRKLILNNNQPIQLKEKKNNNKDYKRILFLINKASNNINQVAKILNSNAKLGNLDDKKLPLIFNLLTDIKNIMGGIDEK